MTISNKSSSITKKASAVTLLIITIVAGIVFAAPSLSLAQQQTATGTATVTTPAPLTPEEQQAARKARKYNSCHD